MSMQAHYLKEREGIETLFIEGGFLEYKISGEECYVRSMYVSPEFRGLGQIKTLSEKITKIAKENGCKYLTGGVVPSLNPEMASKSLGIQLKYGFKLLSSHEDFIILKKEI